MLFLTLCSPGSAAAESLMRESPLPGFAGEAGLLDGRVVVAIAKGMAMRGLRPEALKQIAASGCTWLRLGSCWLQFSLYVPKGDGVPCCGCSGKRIFGACP